MSYYSVIQRVNHNCLLGEGSSSGRGRSEGAQFGSSGPPIEYNGLFFQAGRGMVKNTSICS